MKYTRNLEIVDERPFADQQVGVLAAWNRRPNVATSWSATGGQRGRDCRHRVVATATRWLRLESATFKSPCAMPGAQYTWLYSSVVTFRAAYPAHPVAPLDGQPVWMYAPPHTDMYTRLPRTAPLNDLRARGRRGEAE
jgi:hypothetical protein